MCMTHCSAVGLIQGGFFTSLKPSLMRFAASGHPLEPLVLVQFLWFDVQAVFRSSKSFLDMHEDALFRSWSDPMRILASRTPPLMRFTASSSVEDSHDTVHDDTAAWSSLTSVIITARRARENFADILINCCWLSYSQQIFFSVYIRSFDRMLISGQTDYIYSIMQWSVSCCI